MSFPAYESYRDSGVEWIGEVPEHWTVVPGRRLFKQTRIPAVSGDEQLSSTQKYGVIPQSLFMSLEGQKVVLAMSGTEAFKHVDVDDFVISLRSFQGGIERCHYPGCVSPAYTALKPVHNLAVGYWEYLLKSKPYVAALQSVTDGIREGKTVRYDQFGLLPLPLPTIQEQSAIAAFLDRETGKIDALVEAQRRLIELLKEKRQAVISHAVTKGLNPAAAMKNSGVEWLGDVPAHWDVRPFRYALARIESGTSVNAIDVPAGADELGVLKTSCVYTGSFAPNENKAVVAEEIGRVSCPVRGGTLIVSRMNTPDLVGSAGLVEADVENLYLPDRLWQLHFSGVAPAFAHFWTLTKAYRGQVQIACAGTSSSMQNLSQDQLRSFILPFPPHSEQLEIVVWLNTATAKNDGLVTEAEAAISLLQERRAALISAAVAGKIDVRGVVSEQAEAA